MSIMLFGLGGLIGALLVWKKPPELPILYLALFIASATSIAHWVTQDELLFAAALILYGIAGAFAVVIAVSRYLEATMPVEEEAEPPPQPVEVKKEEPKKLTPEEAFDARTNFTADTRSQHTLVLGASGSGKTQLLQKLIANDVKTRATVIVMAPKGNLIPNLMRTELIDPHRLIIVRPEDPIGLNVFNMKGETNSVVDLIQFVFSALNTETTGKQTGFLRYCILLCLATERSTILTLREVIKGKKFDTSKLSVIAQEFFKEQFPKSIYNETKEQLLARLDAMLGNDTVVRILSSPKTTLDIGKAMIEGKVVLIDTSIARCGASGSAFLGKLMIALIALASQQRDTTKNLKSVFVYCDEAGTYLSEDIEGILERSRESRVGWTLATQQLSQFKRVSSNLESSVLTNTATKFVGKCPHDASSLSKLMNISAERLQNQQAFHFFFQSPQHQLYGMYVQVPLKFLEDQPRRSDEEMQALLAENRVRYGVRETEIKPDEPDDTRPTLPHA